MTVFSHNFKLAGTLFIALIVLAACSTGPKEPGKYAEVAQCLTEKGVIMYGAYWCSHCDEQKQLFGDDAQYLTYQECDDNGPAGDRQACLEAGVTSYPTWKFPGQGNLIGNNPVFVLAKIANCEDKLPAEDLQALKEAEVMVEASSAGLENTDSNTTTSAPGETGQPEPVGRTTDTTSDDPIAPATAQ